MLKSLQIQDTKFWTATTILSFITKTWETLYKTDELLTSVNKQHTPHIIWLMENYMKLTEMLPVKIKNELYELASTDKCGRRRSGSSCKRSLKCNTQTYSIIVKNKTLSRACGTTRNWTPQHVSGKRKLPKRDSEHFLGMLHIVIDFLYKPKAESVMCDNINTDSLVESYCQDCLTSLLPFFHLMWTVNFITQIPNYKPASDNI
jgi:hypothetical protein